MKSLNTKLALSALVIAVLATPAFAQGHHRAGNWKTMPAARPSSRRPCRCTIRMAPPDRHRGVLSGGAMFNLGY